MLELHKKKNSLPPSAERAKVEREIAVTDEKIDDIVYGLYGMTERGRGRGKGEGGGKGGRNPFHWNDEYF